MKRMIHFLICACMLAVGVNMSLSQPITIDSNDVKSMFTVGKTITYHQDNLTTS